MNDKIEELKIGKTQLFAIIHFSLLIMCIFIMWVITYPVVDNWNIEMKCLRILISGIAGIGIWFCLIPTLRKMENDWLFLENYKIKHGKYRKD
jgi:type VI protein secretion system component VasK